MKFSQNEIDEIVKQVKDKNPDLGEIIRDLFKCLQGEIGRITERIGNKANDNNEPITTRDIEPKDIFNCIAHHGNILRFPGDDNDCPCAKYFIGIAFGSWHEKYGFTGAAKRAMEHWLACYNDNAGTVILTDAWDTTNFKKNYERAFNNYTTGCPTPPGTLNKHTICVIFFGKRISIEYIN